MPREGSARRRWVARQASLCPVRRVLRYRLEGGGWTRKRLRVLRRKRAPLAVRQERQERRKAMLEAVAVELAP